MSAASRSSSLLVSAMAKRELARIAAARGWIEAAAGRRAAA